MRNSFPAVPRSSVGTKTPPPIARATKSPTNRFAYNWPSAIRAAVIAAAAITLYMLVVPKMLGIEEMDIGITIGRLADPDGGIAASSMRVAWHVGNGLCYVFAYAAILLFVRKQSTVATGAVFGLFLLLAGPMFLIPICLEVFPSVASGTLTNPGVFMLDLGYGWLPAATDLGAHLLHGILTGAIYKHHVVRL